MVIKVIVAVNILESEIAARQEDRDKEVSLCAGKKAEVRMQRKPEANRPVGSNTATPHCISKGNTPYSTS